MRIVFDTSVVIPMIIDVSLSNRLAARLRSHGHTIIISPGIVEEARFNLESSSGLRRWLAKDDPIIQEFLDQLPRAFEFASPLLEIPGAVPGDPDDDHVLATALSGSADFLVTEDHHLLSLGVWRKIRIVSRAEMMAELDRRTEETPENNGA